MGKDKKKFTIPNIYDILLALIGVSLCGIGVGFANCAALGLDSIGIFYDGIRNILNFSPDMLGVTSFIVSGVILVFLFFASRKYVSLGTLIYIIAYGSFITVGSIIYRALVFENNLFTSIVFSCIGYILLYIGLAIYIAIDIGMDAFTGIVLYLSDITHFEFKYVKIAFDIVLIIIGAVLGGALGVPTVITMVVGGPLINFFTKRFQGIYFKIKLRSMKASKKNKEESPKQN